MGQLLLAGQIADGIDVGNIGTHFVIHLDKATVHLHPNGFQPQCLGVGLPSGRHDHCSTLGGQCLTILLEGTNQALLDRQQLGPGIDFHTSVGKQLGHGPANVRIVAVEDTGQHFNDGDLLAQAVKQGGKLHADDAAADDDHGIRALLQGEDPVGVHHTGQVRARHRDGGGDGTGSQDDLIGLYQLLTHLDGMQAGEDAFTSNDLGAMTANQVFHTAAQLLDHLISSMV